MKAKRFIVGAALLGACLLAGQAHAIPQFPVDIVDFAYQPASTIQEINSLITWTNRGTTMHTVTFDAGTIDSGPIAPGQTFTVVFADVGPRTDYCAIHPSMKGTITLVEQQLPPNPLRVWLPLIAADGTH